MNRIFLQAVFLIILPVVTIDVRADLKLISIVKNEGVELCAEKSAVIDSDCLSAVSEKTEKDLSLAYQNKLNEISTYDYSQWWMGKKEQREEMKKSFIRSQAIWEKYRQEYCKSASAGGESVGGYGLVILSCQVNMAIRRIEEIRMVHPDLSDE